MIYRGLIPLLASTVSSTYYHGEPNQWCFPSNGDHTYNDVTYNQCIDYCNANNNCVITTMIQYANGNNIDRPGPHMSPDTAVERCDLRSTCTIVPHSQRRVWRYIVTTAPPSPPQAAASAPPSPPQAAASAHQDPHLVGAHGDTMDFRGRNNTLYAILSAPRLSFALRTNDATFILIPQNTPKLVHGSFFSQAYWKVRTVVGTEFVVNTSASRIGFDVVDTNGALVVSRPHMWTEFCRDDMRILYKQATLVLRVAGWETNVTRKPVYNRLTGPEWRFDLTIRPLSGSAFAARHGNASSLVAPHGLLGQTWDEDGVAIDGAQDDYHTPEIEVWTKSMAEGGIEGDAGEYELPNKFSHEFKFSRYDVTGYTPPRVTSRLHGNRHREANQHTATSLDKT